MVVNGLGGNRSASGVSQDDFRPIGDLVVSRRLILDDHAKERPCSLWADKGLRGAIAHDGNAADRLPVEWIERGGRLRCIELLLDGWERERDRRGVGCYRGDLQRGVWFERISSRGEFRAVAESIAIVIRRQPRGAIELRIGDPIEHFPNALVNIGIDLPKTERSATAKAESYQKEKEWITPPVVCFGWGLCAHDWVALDLVWGKRAEVALRD